MTNAIAKIKEQMNFLSEEERLHLLMDLWSTLSGGQEIALSDEDKAMLDKRLAEHEANPDDTIPADEVIARLRAKDRA